MRCWRCNSSNADGAITCARCGAALSPRSPLSGARRQGGVDLQSAERRAVSTPAPRRARFGGRTFAASLMLAALLGLTGYGAVRAAELLQQALRPAISPADVAATACTAYATQNYALLTAEIDPRPVPPASSDTFNPAVIQTQLRSLDKIQGIVERCDPGHFTATRVGGQLPLSLRRTRVSAAITVTLIMRQQSDGSWKISRETDFTGTPAG